MRRNSVNPASGLITALTIVFSDHVLNRPGCGGRSLLTRSCKSARVLPRRQSSPIQEQRCSPHGEGVRKGTLSNVSSSNPCQITASGWVSIPAVDIHKQLQLSHNVQLRMSARYWTRKVVLRVAAPSSLTSFLATMSMLLPSVRHV